MVDFLNLGKINKVENWFYHSNRNNDFDFNNRPEWFNLYENHSGYLERYPSHMNNQPGMVDFEKFFNIEIENYRSENYFFELETGFDNIGFWKV